MIATYSLNRISLLFRDRNGVSTRRQLRIILDVLAQELKELLLILSDELSELRIAVTNLLENRLQHLRLLLNELSQLLEVRVVTQKF